MTDSSGPVQPSSTAEATSTNRLRDGRFDAEQQRVPELVRFIEAHEPRLIAFNEYVNQDHSQVSVVQFHPDAASMKFHLASSAIMPGRLTLLGEAAQGQCSRSYLNES